MFQLNIVTTEKCCLACKYCYVHQNPTTMSNGIIDKTLEKLPEILSIFNHKDCSLIYFGGEPLLNFDLIKYTHNKIQKKDYIINDVLISNLLELNEDILNYIQNNNISISWSFDGLWNENNRPLLDGSSSLPIYLNKLNIIKKLVNGCKIMVSPDSLNNFIENFHFMYDELNLNYLDFTIVRDDIWKKSDIELFKIKIKELADIYIKYIEDNKNIEIGLFSLPILDTITNKTFGKRPFGCFVGNSGIAVMPNGDLYPCTRFGSNKLFCYGNINDNINKNKIIEINNKIFMNPIKIDKCKNCKLYDYCNTGCTYSQIKNNYQPIESVCELFFIIYKESLRIYNYFKSTNN